MKRKFLFVIGLLTLIGISPAGKAKAGLFRNLFARTQVDLVFHLTGQLPTFNRSSLLLSYSVDPAPTNNNSTTGALVMFQERNQYAGYPGNLIPLHLNIASGGSDFTISATVNDTITGKTYTGSYGPQVVHITGNTDIPVDISMTDSTQNQNEQS